jgi:hypothetical protein
METNISEVSFVKEESAEYGVDVIAELKPLVALHGIGVRRLSNAVREARQMVSNKNANDEIDESRSHLIRMVLWKLFGQGESIWIHLATKAGNPIPSEILVETYSMWAEAIELAAKYRVDSAAAADAMAKAAYAITDRQANNQLQMKSEEIKNIRRYLFVTYLNKIHRIAAKQGLYQTDYVDLSDWVLSNDISDKGAFSKIMECGLLYNEFLETMDPDIKNIAHARISLGYSWAETANYTGLNMKTAQNIVSAATIDSIRTCIKELANGQSANGINHNLNRKVSIGKAMS